MDTDSHTIQVMKTSVGVIRRVMPTALAIVPVSMLFGVLANRADWSLLEVVLISLLGFSGSGQFALLPLAQSGAGFFTMLLITASINSRYLPIAYMSSGRLPVQACKRAFVAHMLGDEAYATEKEQDHPATIFVIRSTIFIVWALAGLLGALVGKFIPAAWVGPEVNLGYPASVVLMYLSVSQLRLRVFVPGEQLLAKIVATCLCAASALTLIELVGLLYFWIPSVLIATAILARAKV